MLKLFMNVVVRLEVFELFVVMALIQGKKVFFNVPEFLFFFCCLCLKDLVLLMVLDQKQVRLEDLQV